MNAVAVVVKFLQWKQYGCQNDQLYQWTLNHFVRMNALRITEKKELLI